MTLKEFLKLNTDGLLLDIYIYDNKGEYIMCENKRYLLDNNIFLDEQVMSFEIESDGLCVKLDF